MSKKEYELFEDDNNKNPEKESSGESAGTNEEQDSVEDSADISQKDTSKDIDKDSSVILSDHEDAPAQRTRRKKRRRWAFPLGLLIIALAITGLVSIVSSVADYVERKTDDSEERAEYTQMLTWVVANDPDTFDDISKANPEQLRDIAILTLLYDDINTGSYSLSEKGLVVPKDDVERYYTKLFGSELACVHGKVNGYGYTFEYDESAGTYSIPVTGITPPYSPRVTAINKSRDTVVLTVGYIGTSDLEVDVNGELTGAQPEKYMNITLRMIGGEYKISSIQSANPPETDAF